MYKKYGRSLLCSRLHNKGYRAKIFACSLRDLFEKIIENLAEMKNVPQIGCKNHF